MISFGNNYVAYFGYFCPDVSKFTKFQILLLSLFICYHFCCRFLCIIFSFKIFFIHKVCNKYVLHRFVIPSRFVIPLASICNHCPDLKCFSPNLKSLPRFAIFLDRFEIPKTSPICNPSCPDLQSQKPTPFCNLKTFFQLFRFLPIFVQDFEHE